jgi:peptide/nickel transport system permease protein
MRQRWLNRLLLTGVALVAVVTSVAVSAPTLVAHSPVKQRLDEVLRPPSAEHPFGQDALGRDLLSRVAYGARMSLAVGVLAVAGSFLLGLIVGSLAGYFGAWVDGLCMRAVDVMLAFPGLLLAIALAAVLGPGARHMVVALWVTGWTGTARLVRGEMLSLREREFVLAAGALGASPLRIITRHLAPQVLPVLVVQVTFGIAGAILAEAALSFLGLGVRPPTPSWGAMINDGRALVLIAPHVVVFPGLALMVTVLAFNALGDGLRDALDVRERP